MRPLGTNEHLLSGAALQDQLHKLTLLGNAGHVYVAFPQNALQIVHWHCRQLVLALRHRCRFLLWRWAFLWCCRHTLHYLHPHKCCASWFVHIPNEDDITCGPPDEWQHQSLVNVHALMTCNVTPISGVQLCRGDSPHSEQCVLSCTMGGSFLRGANGGVLHTILNKLLEAQQVGFQNELCACLFDCCLKVWVHGVAAELHDAIPVHHKGVGNAWHLGCCHQLLPCYTLRIYSDLQSSLPCMRTRGLLKFWQRCGSGSRRSSRVVRLSGTLDHLQCRSGMMHADGPTCKGSTLSHVSIGFPRVPRCMQDQERTV